MDDEPASAIALRDAIAALGGVGAFRGRLPPPIRIPDGVRTARGAAKELARLGRYDRRVGWALLRLAEQRLAELDGRRLVQDDRPEAALAAWRRWCLREEDAPLSDASQLLQRAAECAFARSQEEFGTYVALKRLAQAANLWDDVGASAGPLVSAVGYAACAGRDPAEDAAGRAMAASLFIAALAEDA